MFTDLPREIQIQVHQLLTDDNFVAAKELHDNWLSNHPPHHSNFTTKNQSNRQSQTTNRNKH